MSARTQAEEVISRLPEGMLVGAEIGVGRGNMSRFLLEKGYSLYMVDSFLPMPWYRVYDEQQGQNRRCCEELCRTYPLAKLLHDDSLEAAKSVEDRSLDFVFIDADHSYIGVKQDVLAWYPKLKPGGLMGGHDYDNPNDRNGRAVKKAVDELAKAFGKSVDVGRDSCWFFK